MQQLSKNELIEYTKKATSRIRNLPLETLCTGGDYSRPDTRYPITISEKYVNDILDLYLTQDWLEADTEPLLDEIESVLGGLDVSVDSDEGWIELFKLVDELSANS